MASSLFFDFVFMFFSVPRLLYVNPFTLVLTSFLSRSEIVESL